VVGTEIGKDIVDPDTPESFEELEHDPEKCEAVFRKDHAQTKT